MIRIPAVCLLLIFLAACGEPSSGDRTFTDDLGRNVTLPDSVSRIVTLAPNLTEIAFAAGAGAQVVAVTTADDHPASVASLPKISALPVDFEAILHHQPDLVLAAADVNSPRDMDALAELGISVYALSFQRTTDVFAAIETVGELAGTTPAATHAADSLRRRLDRTAAEAERREHRPRVVMLIGIETLYSFGAETYVNEMVRLAGGESVTAEIRAPAPVLSDEFILEAGPEVVFVATTRHVSAADLLNQRPAWRSVPAITSDRVFTIHPDLVLRPGPRLVEGVEAIASHLDDATGAEQ